MTGPVARAARIPPPHSPFQLYSLRPGVAHGSKNHPPVDSLKAGHGLSDARLQNIDGAVRAHEQAHLAAMGPYARGAAEYTYLVGPDGQLYAIGGSVAVDLSPVPGDPEATIRKAQAIIRAAYSPLSPSGPDMQVAAEAYQLEMNARKELERKEKSPDDKDQTINLYA
jgi:hypothetical protein